MDDQYNVVIVEYNSRVDANKQEFDVISDPHRAVSEEKIDERFVILDTKKEWDGLSENRRSWFVRYAIMMREDGYFQHETDVELLRGLEMAGA